MEALSDNRTQFTGPATVISEVITYSRGAHAYGTKVTSMITAISRLRELLFGSGMVSLLVRQCVPLLLSFVAMPGRCCFLRVTPERVAGNTTRW